MSSEEWKNYSLSDVMDIIGGGTPKTTIPEYWNGEIPWLSVVDFNGDRKFVSTSEKTITQAGLENSSTKILKKGQLIISARGTVGELAVLTKDMAFNQSCYGLVAKEMTSNEFLYYLVKHNISELRRKTHGAVFDTITMDTFNNVPIRLPSITEQNHIGEILGSLDDKIELNRQMNITLEAMAQTIFKSWFVDFDPVRAKMEGRQPAGMDAVTAALFPDSMDGDVPSGWRIGKLIEDFNLTMGQSPPGNTYNELREGLPFFQGRTDFGFRFPSNRVYCTAPTRIANQGDTLVSVRAPVGDINMASEECALGRGVAAVRHKTGSRSYTHYTLKTNQPQLQQFEAEGTVFGAINKNDFQSIEVLVPEEKVINIFENIIFPIDQLIENNEKQSRNLTRLRDTLLPKLMCGSIF